MSTAGSPGSGSGDREEVFSLLRPDRPLPLQIKHCEQLCHSDPANVSHHPGDVGVLLSGSFLAVLVLPPWDIR